MTTCHVLRLLDVDHVIEEFFVAGSSSSEFHIAQRRELDAPCDWVCVAMTRIGDVGISRIVEQQGIEPWMSMMPSDLRLPCISSKENTIAVEVVVHHLPRLGRVQRFAEPHHLVLDQCIHRVKHDSA